MTQNTGTPSQNLKSRKAFVVAGVLLLVCICIACIAFRWFQSTSIDVSLKTNCVINNPDAKEPDRICQEYIDKIKSEFNKSYSECVKNTGILNPMDNARAIQDCLDNKGFGWRLVDWTSKYQIAELKGHTDQVTSVSFSPDGKIIASGSDDNTIKLWDVASGTELRTITVPTILTESVVFSSDGKMLASGSDDGTIILWDVTSGNKIRTFKLSGASIRDLAFSADGKLMAYGYSQSSNKPVAGLWDIATENKLDSGFVTALSGIAPDQIRSVIFSKDGSRAAISSRDETLEILDVASGSHVQSLSLEPTTAFWTVVFSPNGKYLAVANNVGNSYTIQLWDVTSGKELYILDGHKTDINLLAFSPDGKILVSSAATNASNDKNFIFWDVASGSKLNTLTRPDYFIQPDYMDISPDGRILAFNYGHSIDLWALP